LQLLGNRNAEYLLIRHWFKSKCGAGTYLPETFTNIHLAFKKFKEIVLDLCKREYRFRHLPRLSTDREDHDTWDIMGIGFSYAPDDEPIGYVEAQSLFGTDVCLYLSFDLFDEC